MDYNLIVPFIPNLRRYARALVGDRDGADDLVQDTLERAVRKFHLWRPGEPRARHPDRHRHVAALARARAAAPRDERRACDHTSSDSPMTEEEDRMANADQNAILRRHFEAVLTEPIPARMYLRPPRWIDQA